METQKSEKIVKTLEMQLRNTSRQLVNFHSEEETLQYLSDSFREKLSADFVGIIMKSEEQLILKSWSGISILPEDSFPLPIECCEPGFLLNSKTYEQVDQHFDCHFTKMLLELEVPTWFTFPLKNEINLFGFCIIGYFQKVKLYSEMELIFDEFGKDVAIAMLYQKEKQHKDRLHLLLNYQQALVKETVEGNSIEGITETLSTLLSKSVILLDRFMRPISSKLTAEEPALLDTLVELATYKILHKNYGRLWSEQYHANEIKLAVFPINGGGDLLGYLVIDRTDVKVDDYYRLSIDVARNIYSIQFMKQKLVLDTKEQVKDSFIHKLLVEKISDNEDIFQYANLFNWDIERSHAVAIISLQFPEDSTLNLVEQEANKSLLWDHLKTNIVTHFPDVLVANKEGDMVLISPTVEENQKVYWSKFYDQLKKWVAIKKNGCEAFLAIGGHTSSISDYYTSYMQAIKTLNVVKGRYKRIGFALFDELGAYTLLQHIQDGQMVKLFINQQLEPLLQYEGKNMDLFHTLQVYLEQNGNIKEASEELFIHRSTLLYRLEKIENLLKVDLKFSEHRFNLMMAIKLIDLFYDQLD
ncbi:PucR family transcriptional regulator [Lysinibacillus yapensis]|uniref:PucR family transcriptional regulator n=1 Tax=Ureibacillus yapensis TaxID=2304605 RepID=A0A396SIA0_9BACL|nr:helix-turn-helix domain-containing protein [Lysinibacillus yapensis]RHW38445.1 PucR family transcriptional regulator [Lysinibacillus yapensis]